MFKKVNLNLLSRYLNDASQVVVRTDFNVPIKEGKILDLARVKGNTYTIQQLSPPYATSSITTRSPSYSSHTWAGPMEPPQRNIPFVQSSSRCSNCWASQ